MERDYMGCGDGFRIELDKPGTRDITERVVRSEEKIGKKLRRDCEEIPKRVGYERERRERDRQTFGGQERERDDDGSCQPRGGAEDRAGKYFE